RIDATRPGMEADDGVVRVVLAGQEIGELEVIELPLQRLDLPGELGGELRIVLVGQELVHRLEIVKLLYHSRVALQGGVQARELGGQPLAAGGVVPDARLGELALERARARPPGVDVKGTPWRCRPGGPARRRDRRIRSWRSFEASRLGPSARSP